jgi:prevent-host-death family protein
MTTVNTHQAKTHLSDLLVKVETKHEKIIICRNGKPVAQLLPWVEQKKNPLQQSLRLKKVIFHGDPTEPLPNEAWPEPVR